MVAQGSKSRCSSDQMDTALPFKSEAQKSQTAAYTILCWSNIPRPIQIEGVSKKLGSFFSRHQMGRRKSSYLQLLVVFGIVIKQIIQYNTVL